MIIKGDTEVGEDLRQSRETKQAFVQTFLVSEHGQAVSKDLLIFCQALVTTVAMDKDGRVDPLMSMFNEGKRAVWNRIAQRLGLSTEELYALCYGRYTIKKENDA